MTLLEANMGKRCRFLKESGLHGVKDKDGYEAMPKSK